MASHELDLARALATREVSVDSGRTRLPDPPTRAAMSEQP